MSRRDRAAAVRCTKCRTTYRCPEHTALFFKLYRKANGEHHPDYVPPARAESYSRPTGYDLVSNQLLRDRANAMLEDGVTMRDLAGRAGYRRRIKGGHWTADTVRLRNDLGMGNARPASRISYTKALHLAQSFGLDPVDVDL